eukprot:TRINITY_DN4037_c2_g1_i1.p1 TRINITY_DN4037_c2_g1~~TRINITY_DN4037_c2_g1_i1.p1  ORF type:complete len:568 (+),score=211.78 TRINITY_DN4037_c2_g1_i1:117-1820(+)
MEKPDGYPCTRFRHPNHTEGKLHINAKGITFSPKVGAPVPLNKADIESLQWIKASLEYELRVGLRGGGHVRFQALTERNFKEIDQLMFTHIGRRMERVSTAVAGKHWGKLSVKDGEVEMNVDGLSAFSVPLSDVQSAGEQTKNVVTLNLEQSQNTSRNAHELSEIRFYIPPEMKIAGVEGTGSSAFHQVVKEEVGKDIAENFIATLSDVKFKVPRSNFVLKFSDKDLHLQGKTYQHRIPYSWIERMMYLIPGSEEKEDQGFFLVILDTPISQGKTRYSTLVIEVPPDEEIKEENPVELNLTDEQLRELVGAEVEEGMGLRRLMFGKKWEVLAQIFRHVAKKRIFGSGNFRGFGGVRGLECHFRGNQGFFVPMGKSLAFIPTSPIWFLLREVTNVVFEQEGAGRQSFDIAINKKGIPAQIKLDGISMDHSDVLESFFREKKIHIEHIGGATAAMAAEEEHMDVDEFGGEEDDESEEDEDFRPDDEDSDEDREDEKAERSLIKDPRQRTVKSRKTRHSRDDDDDDDDGDGDDGKQERKKKRKKRKTSDKKESDHDDDDDDSDDSDDSDE